MTPSEPTAEQILAGLDATLVAALSAVEIVVADVDGVLTDGSILIDQDGHETMRFHVRDGSGIWMLTRHGIRVALLTGRATGIPEARAASLPIAEIVSGCLEKGAGLHDLLDRLGVPAARCLYVGDDLLDGPALRLAGVAVVVADAAPEVVSLARYVTRRRGGHGAVREIADLVLAAQGARVDLLDRLIGDAAPVGGQVRT